MGAANELHFEYTKTYSLPRADLTQFGASLQANFREFSSQKTKSQRRSINNRHAHFREHKGNAANMIFVPMGDGYSSYLVLIALQESEIRQNHIYAEHLLGGESHPGINHK
ncbi:MAG: hypothetical protein BWY75_03386 [bacterium ADurb.Bin425]|nr:MAG: hypothetical protein BWY75_03386 [bacterium ADurb.Bin425]